VVIVPPAAEGDSTAPPVEKEEPEHDSPRKSEHSLGRARGHLAAKRSKKSKKSLKKSLAKKIEVGENRDRKKLLELLTFLFKPSSSSYSASRIYNQKKARKSENAEFGGGDSLLLENPDQKVRFRKQEKESATWFKSHAALKTLYFQDIGREKWKARRSDIALLYEAALQEDYKLHIFRTTLGELLPGSLERGYFINFSLYCVKNADATQPYLELFGLLADQKKGEIAVMQKTESEAQKTKQKQLLRTSLLLNLREVKPEQAGNMLLVFGMFYIA